MFAKRMKNLESSGIRKIFELASKMKNPIDLSLGQPDFDVPEVIKDAAIKAIKENKNKYTVTGGIPELKESVLSLLKKEGLNVESLIITSGASGGLVLALLALSDEEVSVFVPDPYFATYLHMIKLAEGRVKIISTYPDFRLTPNSLEEAFKNDESKKKILIYNSPVNPTGICYTEDEIKELVRITKKYGVFVISDEVYDKFSFDYPHVSWLKYDDSALLVRTFGKTLGITGWRIGFAAGKKALIDQMTMLAQFTFVCVNTPSQWACIYASEINMDQIINEYKKRRDLAYEMLKSKFEVVKPEGAFYIFPKVPDGDVERFMKKCLQKEILVVPGSVFSSRNTNIRISLAAPRDKLEKGLEILCKM